MIDGVDEVVSDSSFSTSALVENAPIISILGAVIFFIVAHPFLFRFVDSIIESVVGTGVQRDLLVLLHSVVFGLLMFGSIYLLDFVM